MKIDVLGLKIDDVTMNEAVERVFSFVSNDTGRAVYTPNAEMAMAAVSDPEYMAVLNSADMLIPDGAGVVLGSKILGTPIGEKVAGIELVLNLLSSGKELSVFLYGGEEGVADKATANIESRYPSVKVCGTIHGYHKNKEDHIKIINEAKPDLILVGLSFPGQERWINSILPDLEQGTAIGCGGTLNFLAGVVKRSPSIMIKLNLEWLDRLIRQPKRLGRMMRIPVFLFRCLKKRLS